MMAVTIARPRSTQLRVDLWKLRQSVMKRNIISPTKMIVMIVSVVSKIIISQNTQQIPRWRNQHTNEVFPFRTHVCATKSLNDKTKADDKNP